MSSTQPSPTTSLSSASYAARRALIDLGRRYDAKGWLLGTCGNLSARFAGDRVVVTASGRHKGMLTVEDFVETDLDGAIVAAPTGAQPSAEASIHLALYRQLPGAQVALHVHTVASTLCRADLPSDSQRPAMATFRDQEMIKGWGLWNSGAVASLPIFENHCDVATIANDIQRWYQASHPPQSAQVPALLIAAHGITAWGQTAFCANRHLEVAEFLCQLQIASGSPPYPSVTTLRL